MNICLFCPKKNLREEKNINNNNHLHMTGDFIEKEYLALFYSAPWTGWSSRNDTTVPDPLTQHMISDFAPS